MLDSEEKLPRGELRIAQLRTQKTNTIRKTVILYKKG